MTCSLYNQTPIWRWQTRLFVHTRTQISLDRRYHCKHTRAIILPWSFFSRDEKDSGPYDGSIIAYSYKELSLLITSSMETATVSRMIHVYSGAPKEKKQNVSLISRINYLNPINLLFISLQCLANFHIYNFPKGSEVIT